MLSFLPTKFKIEGVSIEKVTYNRRIHQLRLNEQNTHIQLAREVEENRKLPFLDCLISRDGNSLQTIVYIRRTHTERILDESSYNPTLNKNGSCGLSKIFRDSHKGYSVFGCAARSCLCYASWTNHRNPCPDRWTKWPLSDLLRTKARVPKSPKSHNDTVKYQSFKNLDKDRSIYDLNNAPWSLLDIFENVDDKLDTWELTQHTPIVEKRVKRKKLPPRVNGTIMEPSSQR